MIRPSALAAALCLMNGAAFAQTTPPAPKAKKAPAKPKTPPKAPKGADQAASPAKAGEAPAPAAEGAPPAATTPASPAAAEPPKAVNIDPEEFRRQVMEEVRRELQKTKDEVKQETAWVEQDSQARVHDSEAVEALKQRVNLFQPHGYVRLRGEYFNNMSLGRGFDAGGFATFPGPFIGDPPGKSQSDANFRFRFEPTLEISEDLSIYSQFDILDNVLLGSSPLNDQFISPFVPLSLLVKGRAGSPVNVKRVWGRVNTQVGEILFGRMGYHWGLGILHNDGNCLDCDFGDTYDRVAFAPREFKGHRLAVMFDVLSKGQFSTGERGELGRQVDLDTLDDGYRIALEITRVDTPEEVKRKLEANQWVINYGLVVDYRGQSWDTPTLGTLDVNDPTIAGAGISPRSRVVHRSGKLYQPDAFVSLRRKKWRLDAEFATSYGNIGTHQQKDFDPATVLDPAQLAALQFGVTFLQFGGALQTDIALLPADALLLGLEWGAASGDKGAFGFGARPFRSGSGTSQPVGPGENPWRTTARGDIDGTHLDFTGGDLAPNHARMNNFVFNRAFNIDLILWRNLVTAITSAWYLKPSVRYRPTGRKTGGGDDTGFEISGALIYSQAWYPENTPGISKALGLEADLGITYDTSDRLHTGLQYGLLLPFNGLQNVNTNGTGVLTSPSIAHAVRFIMAIPF
jgi:uncharacterized protein (TIGR04551 family)